MQRQPPTNYPIDLSPVPIPSSGRRRALSALSALSLMPWLQFAKDASAADPASAIHALPRVALVVGNSRYADAPLQNPVNDAEAISGELKRMNFAVSLQLNTGKTDLESAIRAYSGELARQKGVGLFYFAGHGLQQNWRNFLVPVDAVLDRADDVAGRTVEIATLLAAVGKAGNALNIVILDACRDNPFGAELKGGKGLSQMDAPNGTLLAYATAPGSVAADGNGRNGLYTEHLLREMRTADAKIEDVFKRVRLAVRRASKGQQVPWESTSLEEDFYFLPPASLRKQSQDELDKRFAEELAVWEKSKSASLAAPVESYLERFPSGRFAELAQLRLDGILAQQGEKKIQIVSEPANPFSKGTAIADLNYRVGDRLVYRTIDLVTKAQGKALSLTITALKDGEVIYNNGELITDVLGNSLLQEGMRMSPSQFYAAEYAVGKKWTTRFSVVLQSGANDTLEFDLRVATREVITVPAGSFDAFRVEFTGWVLTRQIAMEGTAWVAPDKVRRPIAVNRWRRQRGQVIFAQREELESFAPAS